MSGTLSAETTAEGARFTIALPLSEEATANDSHNLNADIEVELLEVTPSTSATHDLHVLVVEDEAEAARAMADYLNEEGFSVTTASDGHEGLKAFQAQRPDIVITDIRMPGLSGTELIQAIREVDPDLPIIAVTGHMGETESIDPGPTSAPIEVLKKPVSLAELSRKVGALRGH